MVWYWVGGSRVFEHLKKRKNNNQNNELKDTRKLHRGTEDELNLREGCLALLHVLALSPGPGLPTEVHSDAHEESALVEEVAGDVHAHQQQEKDNNEDAYDGSGAQAWATAHGVWRARTGGEGGRHKHNRQERQGGEEERGKGLTWRRGDREKVREERGREMMRSAVKLLIRRLRFSVIETSSVSFL